MSLDLSVKEKQLPKGDTWSVHKFGGTCVGTALRIKNVADIIISDDSERKVVVVSAMSKVTDMMYDLIHKAQARDESYISALDAVLEKHTSAANEILDGDELALFLSKLREDINNLKAMLRAIYIGNNLYFTLCYTLSCLFCSCCFIDLILVHAYFSYMIYLFSMKEIVLLIIESWLRNQWNVPADLLNTLQLVMLQNPLQTL